jgi:uncharacterized repeat protein (TIGR03803 family)
VRYRLFLPLFLLSFSSTFAQYSKIFDFSTCNVAGPSGNLSYDGTYFYGTTPFGSIYKVKPDGSNCSSLFSLSGTNGATPNGGLASDGTYLYGTTVSGGTNDRGTIFKIKTDGTGFAKLYDFNDSISGSEPFAPLIFDGTYLYGTTRIYGGINPPFYHGTVYKIKPDGTGFSVLKQFDGTEGSTPVSALFYNGTFLYGTAKEGGASNNGIIFRIKPDGTEYTKLADFNGANGSNPQSALMSDGTFLYGTTSYGGSHNWGVIYKIMPDGSQFTKLYDFVNAEENPFITSLTLYGPYLYGVAGWGDFGGAMYKIKPDGTEFSHLVDFTGPNGHAPSSSLVIVNGSLYGTTMNGGDGCINAHSPSGCGVLFRYQPNVAGIDPGHPGISVTITPNPSKNFVTINGINTVSNLSVAIFDVLGSCLLKKTYNDNNNLKIDLADYNPGMYFLEIVYDQSRITKKIIVSE